ncbi:uncharacterized protein LOC119074619 [Bradysia coprophila]|uniref:uncharacterized protein LOC119074619 n=1 Tax=Bradysia coprophila TaxID=38358 RepID=UPI00187DC8D3|nr:uncharacterized protein LOC119074619 [Bradysia coprophila]
MSCISAVQFNNHHIASHPVYLYTMHRRTRQSEPPQKHVDSSSSDSDSDNSAPHQTASDVINSFLRPSRTVIHVYTPKSRKASDVINSFLQKNITVDQASRSQFDSALDVINSYLRRDNFGENGAGVSSPSCSDNSPSESECVANKRRRRVTESSTSDSASEADENVAKRRRIENSSKTSVIVSTEPIVKVRREPGVRSVVSIPEASPNPINRSTSSTTGNKVSGAEDPEPSHGNHTVVAASQEESQQSASVSTTRRTLRSNASKENASLEDADRIRTNVKPKRKAPVLLKMSFTREVFSRKTRIRRVIEQQTTIRDYQIPKAKYDRALEMLNATECRYDETPVDYNAPKPWYDFRQSCNGRRHAEATYDTDKLGTSALISLTRIILELDNCLKRENWSQMAELVYFGCSHMKTDHIRRAIGGAFFTYALLLLLLDSSPDSISTLAGKRIEITKFLTALGNEPDEIEEFLNQLHLVMNESDTADGLLTIKSEEE